MIRELNVLIVDDKEETTELFSRMLKVLSKVVDVTSCNSLEEAQVVYSEKPTINVVILDLNLDLTSGTETLKQFKKLFPDLPVIVVTGEDGEELSYDCFALGADDFLAKPHVSAALLYKACIYAVEKNEIRKEFESTEAALASLLNVAPISIGMAIERNIKWVNDYTTELTGYSKDEIEGQDARLLYADDEEYERVGRVKYPAVYEGQKGIVETKWITKDGKVLDILLGSGAIGPKTPSAGIIFTALDITKMKRAKARIQEERDKATRYLDIAGTLILVLDREGIIRLINRRGCEILGYNSAEELLGKNWFDTCICPEERKTVREVFARVLAANHIPVDLERRENKVLRKDGSARLISWHNSFISDNGGVVSLSSGEDITEQRRQENIVHVRLALLEYSADHTLEELLIKTLDEVCEMTESPIGFYHFVDRDEGHITLTAWSTRTTQEFCTAEGTGAHYPVELAGVWADAIREKQTIIHNDYESLENKKGMPKGHAQVIREMVVPILRGGKVVGILGIGNKPTDYTIEDKNLVTYLADVVWEAIERKKTSEELQKSEEKYRAAIDTAGEGILVVQDGVLKYANSRLAEILKYDNTDDLVGLHIRHLLHDSSREMIIEQHKLRMSGQVTERRIFNIKGLTRYNEVVDIELRVSTLEWDGRPAALGFIADVTAKIILQERQRLIIDILKLLNAPYSGSQTISSLLKLIQDFTGIEAIALRLQEGQDYPYFVYKGFSKEFISEENQLCSVDDQGCPVTDSCGMPVLDCMCGCVIRGSTDPSLPFFTENGSFWTNSTTALLSSLDKEDAHKQRNRCNTEGYESVAIIPLSTGEENIGSIQLNDSRRDRFTATLIQFMEETALTIAVAVKRAWQEDRIKSLEIAKTKDLLQSSRLLNSGIAHELRTPMQALLNSLELIKEEVTAHCEGCKGCTKANTCDVRDIILELADDGLDRTEYSVKVLNSLSEYSKIATGEDVHLINVVPELKTIMRTLLFTDQFKSMGSDKFKIECEGEGQCYVSINRVDFSQLITNLCRNAREAIDHDDPEIIIAVRRDAPNVKIVVTDNGRGVDAKLGDKIFEPYFSTKENPEGYNQGLGLAMVRDIISAYGGSISYTSKPGHTEFVVKLPCEHE